jgi:hypothetical protein
MNERFVARGYAVTQLLEKTRTQRERAEKLDAPKKEKRLASITAGLRREMDKIDEGFALEPFVSWCVRKRKDVECEVPFLERHAERETVRQSQRIAHEGAKQERAIAPEPKRVQQTERPSIAPKITSIDADDYNRPRLLPETDRKKKQSVKPKRGMRR